MPRQYPPQFRERALRLVEETLPDQKCEFAAMKKVAGVTRGLSRDYSPPDASK